MPVGQHSVKICVGTACHVKGAPLISDAFKRVLEINETANISPDGLFSIEEVACLGCCTLAPVVQIGGKTYGHVKPTEAEDIIHDFLQSGSLNEYNNEEESNGKFDAEIRIGIGSCCVAGGSKEILSEIITIKERYGLNIGLKPVGCVGVCNQTPLMEIVEGEKTSARYTNVNISEVEDILLKHVRPSTVRKKIKRGINDLVDTFMSDAKESGILDLSDAVREKYLNNFLDHQVHIATLNSGYLSPESYEEYRQSGGFLALEKCLSDLSAESVIGIISESGLRGRGGGGFSTGKKWQIVRSARTDPKYVICNGDEGDPGAFMDRMLLESFPYRIIEGMLIAGYATGASEGIFYIRAEYPLAVTRIRHAIEMCYSNGMLGNNIKGSRFSFNINIFEGAGAFVCGEETALILSLEGRRGTPYMRPPYPAIKG